MCCIWVVAGGGGLMAAAALAAKQEEQKTVKTARKHSRKARQYRKTRGLYPKK